MSNLDQKKLQALANDLAKDIKTQDNLAELSSALLKMTVEAALGTEEEVHLGYAKHKISPKDSNNSRNGYSCSTPSMGLANSAVDLSILALRSIVQNQAKCTLSEIPLCGRVRSQTYITE